MAIDKLKVVLRLLAIIFTLEAALLAYFKHQTAKFGDHSILVKFGDLNPNRYFIGANIVAAAYSFFVFLILRFSKSLLWKTVVAFDAVLMVILWSSCSAAVTVIYLEIYGNSHTYWIPICSRVPSYCGFAIGAISGGFIGALAYLLLHLVSIQEALNALLID